MCPPTLNSALEVHGNGHAEHDDGVRNSRKQKLMIFESSLPSFIYCVYGVVAVLDYWYVIEIQRNKGIMKENKDRERVHI